MFESPLSQRSVVGNLQDEWRTWKKAKVFRNCSICFRGTPFGYCLLKERKHCPFWACVLHAIATVTLSEPILASLLSLKMGSLFISFFRSAELFFAQICKGAVSCWEGEVNRYSKADQWSFFPCTSHPVSYPPPKRYPVNWKCNKKYLQVFFQLFKYKYCKPLLQRNPNMGMQWIHSSDLLVLPK